MKRMLALAAALLMMLTFTGCWNYHEIETLQIVSGVAVDVGRNGYKYHVTFECIKLGQGTQQPGSPQPVILETDGNTIFDAVRSALNESDKKLYFSHCEIVILSSQIAKGGIKSLLDWFMRDAEPRDTLEFLVSKADTAGVILQQKPKTGQVLSYQISNALHESANAAGKNLHVQLYQINNTLNTPGNDLTLPAIELKQEAGGETVQVQGDAVFQEDKMVGYITADQAKTLNFVLNNINGGLLLTGKNPGDQDLALEIISNSTKVAPAVSNGIPTMNIDIHMTAAYAEQNSTEDVLTKEGVEKVAGYAERTLKTDVENTIKLVQTQYDADIFDFGSAINQSMPDEWDKLKSGWRDTFKKLKYHVNAEVEIKNAATLVDKGGK